MSIKKEYVSPKEYHRILQLFREQEEKEKKRQSLFGKTKQIIYTEAKDFKFVFIGSRIYYSKEWNTFPDFLISYIWDVLGADWAKNEIQKPLEDRHQILKWYDGFLNFSKQQSKGSDGLIKARLNGVSAAFFLLAYDLYILRHHSSLQEYVVRRLKDSNQFQGARYELFVTAACIRAGFDIVFEEERKGGRRYVEFIAAHKETGQRIAVEAKSKHRRGVLGVEGEKIPEEKIRLGSIIKLINQAVSKEPSFPLVVFVDVNLPPSYVNQVLDKYFIKKFPKLFKNVIKSDNGKDLFNLIILSNHPHHYGRDDEPNPEDIYSLVISQNPNFKLDHPKSLNDLIAGTLQYGNIPNEFPSNDNPLEEL
ncbi:MAG: hypothetical protein QQN41_03635 [Nitrosopumilus sp.]